MSQVTHGTIPLRDQIRAHCAASVRAASEPATAGHPDESGFAAAIGSANGRTYVGSGNGRIKVSPTIRHK